MLRTVGPAGTSDQQIVREFALKRRRVATNEGTPLRDQLRTHGLLEGRTEDERCRWTSQWEPVTGSMNRCQKKPKSPISSC